MTPLIPELWPHQKNALEAIIGVLSKKRRAQLHMACGTGKTAVGAEIVRRFMDRNVIWLCPTVELMVQTSDVLRERLPAHEQLLVAHNRTKSARKSYNFSNDPELINHALSARNIILSTYNSFPLIQENIKHLTLPIGLIIADEAHKTAGLSGKLFGRWLDDNINVENRLAMTATPRNFAPAKIDSIKVSSMNDEVRFGQIAYQYDFNQGLKDKILCPLELVIPMVDGICNLMVQVESLLQSKKKYELSKILTFHNSVKEASLFCEKISEHGVECVVVTGNSPVTLIQEAIRKLKEPNRDIVVSNVRLFSEGINVPSIDAVFFTSYKDSHVVIAQQIGRASRNSPGKKKGYIILPPATGNDISYIFQNNKVSKIWQTFFHLLDFTGSDFRNDRIQFPLNISGVSVNADFSKVIELEISKVIEIIGVDAVKDRWFFIALSVLNYIKDGNHPFADDAPHRIWLSSNRKKYQCNRLNRDKLEFFSIIEREIANPKNVELTSAAEYIDRLEKGGPPEQIWSIKIRDRKRMPGYDDLYRRLLAYRDNKKNERDAKMEKFLSAYSRGEIIDRSLYSQFVAGVANCEMNDRFISIHNHRISEKNEYFRNIKSEIKQMHENGEKLVSIARRFNLHPSTIAHHLLK